MNNGIMDDTTAAESDNIKVVKFFSKVLRKKSPYDPYPIVNLFGHRSNASLAIQRAVKNPNELKNVFLSFPEIFNVICDSVAFAGNSDSPVACDTPPEVPPQAKKSQGTSSDIRNNNLPNNQISNPNLKHSSSFESFVFTTKDYLSAVDFYSSIIEKKCQFSYFPMKNLIGHRNIASKDIQNIARTTNELKIFFQKFPKIFSVQKESVALCSSVNLWNETANFFCKILMNISPDKKSTLDELIEHKHAAPSHIQKVISDNTQLRLFLSKYDSIFEMKGNYVTVKAGNLSQMKDLNGQVPERIYSNLNGIISSVNSMSLIDVQQPNIGVNSKPIDQKNDKLVRRNDGAANKSNQVLSDVANQAVDFFSDKLLKFGMCRVVAISELFKCKSEAPRDVQTICGNTCEDFKKFLSQYPQTFIVTSENVLARRNMTRKKWYPPLRGIEEPMCSMIVNFFKIFTQHGKPEHAGKLHSTVGKCFVSSSGKRLFETPQDLTEFLDMFPHIFYIFDGHIVNIMYHDKRSIEEVMEKSTVRATKKSVKTNNSIVPSVKESKSGTTSAGINWKTDVLRKTQLVDNLEECKSIVQTLKGEKVIALDCEGYNLGAGGIISLVQIAKENGQVYVFDINKDPNMIKDGNLKEIFESTSIVKVIHDCRNDSANLYREHQVLLTKIFDTRVAHAVIQNPHCKVYQSIAFNKLCVMYGAPINIEKDELKDVYKNDPAFWLKRPLKSDMLAYAALDVACLMPHVYKAMREKLKDSEPLVWQLSEKFSKSAF